ncbi:MAG: dihydropteroate synthase [Acidimicrobiales bacterium]|nr:dihydropteroate synthase [Acidimicrobiales bacterium]
MDPTEAASNPPHFRTDLLVRGRVLDLRAPVLMGVVNANHDSFSDPGELPTLDRQLARVGELVDGGAAVIDVGGQSGITGVPENDPAAERDLVVPLVAAIAREHPGVEISVDTYKPLVAEASLAAGASIVNDVSGLLDRELATIAARHGAALVVMHTRARPKQRMQDPGRYGDDVVADVRDFLAERVAVAVGLGVDERSIVVDPGPDFSKTPHQTVDVLRHLPEINPTGLPMLLAVSRKDFVGAITATPPKERLAGTLAAVAAVGSGSGVILRVHDVVEVARFLAVLSVLRGEHEVAPDLLLPDTLRWSGRTATS